jgi:hypothetical protein
VIAGAEYARTRSIVLDVWEHSFWGHFMSRQFELPHRGRALAVRVRPIDEAWEFWLFENGVELVLGAVLSIDDAAKAWRDGIADPIADVIADIRGRLEAGEIALPDRQGRPGEAAVAARAKSVWQGLSGLRK